MAVDLAKMSLWLATLAKDEPLTFVDHALRDGDSLVGLSQEQIAAFTWEAKGLSPQLELNTRVVDAVDRAVQLRRGIQEAGTGRSRSGSWRTSSRRQTEALQDVRLFGDLVAEAFFLETKPKKRKLMQQRYLQDVQDREEMVHRARLSGKRTESPPFAPFHWEMEFPEVFERKNPGFDALVGNPPFLGGTKISSTLGRSYRDWLLMRHVGSHGNGDLVAHFFRRAFAAVSDRWHDRVCRNKHNWPRRHEDDRTQVGMREWRDHLLCA